MPPRPRILLLTLAAGLAQGCSLAPKSFLRINDPSANVRARAAGLGDGQPESHAIPALIARLDDPDPVVRMVANRELVRRTGQDFGFRPTDEPDDRKTAVSRWSAWWQSRGGTSTAIRTRSTARR